MIASHWFLTHQVVSIATTALVLFFVISLLRQRRPTGNLIAWLLAIVLIPYLGIPLYLMLGGRKLNPGARGKRRLDAEPARWNSEPVPTTLQSVQWLDDGVLAYDCFLSQIGGARHSIRIITFVLVDDDAGRSLVRALIERAQQGLEVRLLI